MTLDEAYKEKGLAVTQIQLWQQRLKLADEAIAASLNKPSGPTIVGVVPNGDAS